MFLKFIIGLDPVKILYEDSEPMYRIDRTDAKFVDIIHTDTNSFGLGGILGHIDFYPNGGRSQPNCSYDDKGTLIVLNVKIIRKYISNIIGILLLNIILLLL